MFWNLVNKNGKTATIIIYGVIGDQWYEEVSAEEIIKDLEALGDVDTINVRINSPGGGVFAGTAIYSALKAHKAHVNVYIEGLCASIATVIAMAGDTITMNDSSMFMIHNPLTIAAGEAGEMRKNADILDKLKDNIINAYLTKVKIGKEDLSKMMDEESYLTAQEALEKGFITNIGFGENNVTNSFDLSHFKNYKNIKNNGSKTEKEEKMTKAEFKNKFPDLYNEIRNEGVVSERARIREIDDISNHNIDSTVINQAKYETFKNANEVALDILKGMKGGASNTAAPPVEEGKTSGSSFVNKFEEKKQDAKDINNLKQTEREQAKGDKETFTNLADDLIAYANGGAF